MTLDLFLEGDTVCKHVRYPEACKVTTDENFITFTVNDKKFSLKSSDLAAICRFLEKK